MDSEELFPSVEERRFVIGRSVGAKKLFHLLDGDLDLPALAESLREGVTLREAVLAEVLRLREVLLLPRVGLIDEIEGSLDDRHLRLEQGDQVAHRVDLRRGGELLGAVGSALECLEVLLRLADVVLADGVPLVEGATRTSAVEESDRCLGSLTDIAREPLR